MPTQLTSEQLAQANEALYACIDQFINYDRPSGLLATMNHLLNAFIDSSHMDGSDRVVVANVIYDATRINAFFVELNEKFEELGYRYTR